MVQKREVLLEFFELQPWIGVHIHCHSGAGMVFSIQQVHHLDQKAKAAVSLQHIAYTLHAQ
jgi:hypothetical protein